MASPPVLCVDNLFDDLLYTGHTLTANEEATDYEVERLANGRRSPADYWTPTTANNDAWAEVDCGQIRSADFIAIDRGSNLEGQTVALEASDDDFTTTEEVFSITFPSGFGAGSTLSATTGTYTEEGAWVKTFDLRAARYWRLYITAAASYTPQVVGLTLGLSWTLGDSVYPDRPWDEDASTPAWQTVGNDRGWSANSSDAENRQGQLSLRLNSFFDDDVWRVFRHVYGRGKPAWFVPDRTQAERAFYAKRPQGGRLAAPYDTGWGPRSVAIPYAEHEPRLT